MSSSRPMAWTALLAASLAAAALRAGGAAADPGPQHLIKMASLAPEGSTWARALEAIDAEVRQQTGGAVGLRTYPGGVQGDDPVVLRKIRIGQLQGAGLTAQGLGVIAPDIMALEMPFLFGGYDEVDYVLQQMDPFYQRALEQSGFVLLGWVDVGFVHILSQQPVRSVDDIRGRKVWRLEDEPITQAIFRRAGVTSVPLGIPDVLLGLQTNLVDVVYAPPSVAIVLQWFAHAKCITELPVNYTLGALLVSRQAFAALEPQQQEALTTISRRRARELSLQTRQDNERAMQVMLDSGLELVSPGPGDLEAFQALVAQTVPDLVGSAFSAEAQELVQQHLRQFRQRRSGGQ